MRETETKAPPPEKGQSNSARLKSTVQDIQARWRRYIPGNRSLVDELIADRRVEAKSE
jgi:hypothetical protein